MLWQEEFTVRFVLLVSLSTTTIATSIAQICEKISVEFQGKVWQFCGSKSYTWNQGRKQSCWSYKTFPCVILLLLFSLLFCEFRNDFTFYLVHWRVLFDVNIPVFHITCEKWWIVCFLSISNIPFWFNCNRKFRFLFRMCNVPVT